MKRCTKCDIEKPLEKFKQDKRRKDGFGSWCKECMNEGSRAWRKSNPERSSETSRAWRDANREVAAEANRVWRENNRERKAKTDRAWVEANREHKAEYSRLWRKDNQEHRAEYHREWAKNNSSVRAKHAARHRDKHPEHIAARAAVNNAVQSGKMIPAKDLICECGAQALEYHHHKGYAPEHHFDVVAVCKTCHIELDNSPH